ncbi:homoserine kinase [Ascidiimonas aurantiaca]|uniref:homoserine kinase n=1 Tax=Ascidiimonas aurantiaca TaxID=1685432 RepID=UPI0030EF3AF5
MTKSIKVHCPATIANISCGFDVLGLCLETIGDEMQVRTLPENEIRISEIKGGDLSLDPLKNVAGVAALALKQHLCTDTGFEISIHKKIKPGSGIGSSAASAAGAVFAINALLNMPLTPEELIPFAMAGEELASGTKHADNVAPALLGGFTLIRSYEPLDVIKIHTPPELYVSVIHPHIEVKTSDARAILKKKIPMEKAITQWGNVGGLISGLYTEDYDLIGRSLEDVIVEPLRSILIPGFYDLKKAALQAGALGCGISGSGPSVFALSKSKETAKHVAKAMSEVYTVTGIPHQVYLSGVNKKGIKIIA